jgi:DNA polymerase
MTPNELIRELEYLRDLGLDDMYLPEGVQTLVALVQGKSGGVPRGGVARGGAAASPVDALAKPVTAGGPQPQVSRPASAAAPPAAPPAQPPATPPATPPAAPPVTGPAREGGLTLPPLLSSQLLSPSLKTMLSGSPGSATPNANPGALTPSASAGGGTAQPLDMYHAMGLQPEDDSLDRIRQDIGDCKRCRLCQDRTNIVFGSGNLQAKLVFVGEGPGEDEDLSGLPFVGRAGQLLTRMIEGTAEKEGIPILRKDVYICNVVKCRPPKNRKPEADEMEICGQFLYRQLAVLQPKAICVLGATAAQALLNTKEKMGDMRGEWQRWRDIPVMVTYHPSFLLRAYSPDAKRLTWEDLKKVLHFVYDDPANLPG